MGISIEDVEHVARLARLSLSDEERELFRRQLSDVLENARKISSVDTTGVEPTSHAIRIVNVVRDDEVGTPLSVDEAVSNAPLAEGGAFKVPRII